MEEKEDPFYCGEEEPISAEFTSYANRITKRRILVNINAIKEKTQEMKVCEKQGHDWQLYTSTLHEERGNDRYVSLDRVIVGGACGRCGVYFKETMKLTPTRTD